MCDYFIILAWFIAKNIILCKQFATVLNKVYLKLFHSLSLHLLCLFMLKVTYPLTIRKLSLVGCTATGL